MTDFKTRFTKPIIAAGLAAAIAFSPATATPARADSDQVAAVIGAGALALIIGGIIASDAQGRGRVTVTTPTRSDRYWNDHNRRDNRRDERPRVDTRKLLPARCDIDVRRGPKAGTYYTKTCLMQNFRNWPMLPERCETRLRTRTQGRIAAYDAQCLARYGYVEAGRDRGRDSHARR